MVVVNRFRWFGWFVLCVAVTLGCYLMSSRVAAERNKLGDIQDSIAKTERDIKALETEFDTRASFIQLQRWNGETLKMSAPTAGQYVRDDAQLASLDADAPAASAQNASVIPAAPAASTPPAPVPAVATAAAKPSAPAPVKAAVAMVSAPIPAKVLPAAAKTKAKPQTVALLDRKLLGDLERGAKSEGGTR